MAITLSLKWKFLLEIILHQSCRVVTICVCMRMCVWATFTSVRGYSWLCTLGLRLAVLRVLSGMLGIKSGSAACKGKCPICCAVAPVLKAGNCCCCSIIDKCDQCIARMWLKSLIVWGNLFIRKGHYNLLHSWFSEEIGV